MQNNKNNGQTRSWNNQNSENVKKGARLKVIAWVIFVIILLFGELLDLVWQLLSEITAVLLFISWITSDCSLLLVSL